jgi:tetratricopeptide (TPR) repeat protein
MGQNYTETDKYEAARVVLERAVGIRRRLHVAQPSVQQYRFELAVALNQLGIVCQRMGKPAEGVATHEMARSICQKLKDECPECPDYTSELARTLIYLGHVADFDQDYGKTISLAGQAADLLERLVKDQPRVADYQFRLAGTLATLSTAHNNMRQPMQAKKAGARAVVVADTLARAHPDVRDYQTQMALARVNYAVALAQLGDHALAAAEVEAAIAKAGFWLAHYNGACAYCLCSATAGRDAELPLAEREKLAAKYLERAMSLLFEAERNGFFKQAQGISLLQSDHDLDPLRQREDFQVLLRKMEDDAAKTGRAERK